jgi:hypothetical protein
LYQDSPCYQTFTSDKDTCDSCTHIYLRDHDEKMILKKYFNDHNAIWYCYYNENVTEITSHFLIQQSSDNIKNISIQMKTGSFIYIFPQNYHQNENKLMRSIKVRFIERAKSTYRYIGIDYNKVGLRRNFFNNYVNCNHGFLEFEWFEPSNIIFFIENCKVKKQKFNYERGLFRSKPSSYESIDDKNYDFSQLRKGLHAWKSYCGFSYNVLKEIPCTMDEYKHQIMSETTKLKRTSQIPSTISRSTIKIQTISQRNQMTSSTNLQTIPQRNQMTSSTNHQTISPRNQMTTSTNLQTIYQSNEIALSTSLLSTSHISENEEIKYSEPEIRQNKWLVIGISAAFIVIFAILIPLFGFLYKLRQQKQNRQSEMFSSYDTNLSDSLEK